MQSLRGPRGTRGTVPVRFRSGDGNGTGNIRVCSCSYHLVPVPKRIFRAAVPITCSHQRATPTGNSPVAVSSNRTPRPAADDGNTDGHRSPKPSGVPPDGQRCKVPCKATSYGNRSSGHATEMLRGTVKPTNG